MFEELTHKIRDLIMSCLEPMSLELIELNIKQRAKTFVVGLLVDRPQGGITIDECSAINKHIVQELERMQLLGENFEVEVASPGVDRPLKTCRDFERVRGRCVRFHLRGPLDHKLEYAGIIREVKNTAVVIDARGQMMELNFDNIHKAVQVL